MTDRHAKLTPKEHVDRFYTVRSQLPYLLRHYEEADNATVEVAQNVRLGVTRSRICSEAIIHISHFKTPETAHYARFRLNDMRLSPLAMDLVDGKYRYVDPNKLPDMLTPLPIQNDLAFMAIDFLRAEREARLF